MCSSTWNLTSLRFIGNNRMRLRSERMYRHPGMLHQFQALRRSVVPSHLKTMGTHTGRVQARANGRFDIVMARYEVAGVSYRYCNLLQRGDGYRITLEEGQNRALTSSSRLPIRSVHQVSERPPCKT
jgi:hypothetical protein